MAITLETVFGLDCRSNEVITKLDNLFSSFKRILLVPCQARWRLLHAYKAWYKHSLLEKKCKSKCNLFTQGTLKSSEARSNVFVHSRSNWHMEVLVFKERGKPENPEKNLSEQGREPTTNSTHICNSGRELNPGHIGGRRALSPLRHPCSPTEDCR